MTTTIPRGPWSRGGRVMSISSVIVAVAGLVTAWAGSAVTADVEQQVGYGVLGIAAVGVVYGGGVARIVTGRRAVGVRRRHLLGSGASRAVATGAVTAAATQGERVAVDGGRRFHLETCPMVLGRPTRSRGRDEQAAAGLLPCGICGS